MKTVRITCTGADVVEIAQMKELQGELKSLSTEHYNMLKKEIIETGFAFPIHLWRDDNVLWLVGGHQRKRTLETMRNEGYEIPPIPVVFVEADSIEQARRRVLQDIAQYGKVERQGLYEFITEAAIGPGDLAESFKIPDLDLPSFNAEFFMDDVGPSDGEGKTGSKEMNEQDFSTFAHKCARCGFEFD